MKSFLLSAGLGTRLRPITNTIPKCLLPINGKPLLQIWLELLIQHGVDQVLLNTHWLADKVEAFVEQGANNCSLSVNGEWRRIGEKDQKAIEKDIRLEDDRDKWPKIRLFYEKELLGSAGTLLANREWVADGQPFFILYGDNLTNVDLGKMHEFHCSHDLPFTLGVFKTTTPKRCGIVETDDSGVVIDFVEKPDNPKSDLAAAGVYMTDSRIFDYYPPDLNKISGLDLGFDVIPNLVGKIKAYQIKEFLIDIGTSESYENAQKEWAVKR